MRGGDKVLSHTINLLRIAYTLSDQVTKSSKGVGARVDITGIDDLWFLLFRSTTNGFSLLFSIFHCYTFTLVDVVGIYLRNYIRDDAIHVFYSLINFDISFSSSSTFSTPTEWVKTEIG